MKERCVGFQKALLSSGPRAAASLVGDQVMAAGAPLSNGDSEPGWQRAEPSRQGRQGRLAEEAPCWRGVRLRSWGDEESGPLA